MITSRDKREYFESECLSYNYFKKKITECDERLEVLNVEINGVSSPGIKEVVCENARNPYRERKNILLTEEDEIQKEKNYWKKRVEFVDTKLDKIEDKRIRNIVTDMYINKMNHEAVAKKYHYSSRTSMYKKINRILDKIL